MDIRNRTTFKITSTEINHSERRSSPTVGESTKVDILMITHQILSTSKQ